MHGGGFLLEIEGVRGVALHPVGHFVLGDAGERLGIADVFGDLLVEPVERVERAAAQRAGDARRVAQIEDRVALGPALDALIDGRQVARAPDGFAGVRVFAAGGQHDEAGQILVFRTQPVSGPSADRGGAKVLVAGVDQQLRRAMVELVGVHRLDKANVVHHRTEMRQPVRQPRPGLAVLLERKLRTQHLRDPLDEGELFAFEEFLRALFAVVFHQLRFVIEQLMLRWRARHVEIDHAFGGSREMRHRRSQRIGRILRQDAIGAPGSAGHRCQPQRPQSGRTLRQKMPASLVRKDRVLKRMHGRLENDGVKYSRSFSSV